MIEESQGEDSQQPPPRRGATSLEPPTAHGTTLLYPSPTAMLRAITSNQRSWAASSAITPSPILFSRQAARAELLALALGHVGQYVDPPAALRDRCQRIVQDPAATIPILIGGHQPSLYHPGVWFKHFWLDALTKRSGGVAVHLLIDNDLVGRAAVQVPCHDDEGGAKLQTVPLDDGLDDVPFERRAITNREFFERFPERLMRVLDDIDRPLAQVLWREKVDLPLLGVNVAARRHRFEMSLGVETLELPLSLACGLSAFAEFLAGVLERADEFLTIHNQLLHEYRQVHRLRSRTHPVPDLVQEGSWCETPFWIWDHQSPHRRRLFCNLAAGRIRLSDRQQIELDLGRRDLSGQLSDLSAQGIAIRPRALTTTMFARLCLGDYFIHGLGGAKYDELTDQIIERFWQVPAPAFGVATATFRLPNTPYLPDLDRQRTDLQARLRQIEQQPDRFCDEGDPIAADLVAKKRELIQAKSTFADQKAFRETVAKIDQALRERLAPQRERIAQELERLERQIPGNRIWGARDYSLACFPESLGHELLALANRAWTDAG